MKDFSQNNEQEIILAHFAGRGGTDMCVLDIGANDGETFSMSRALLQESGMCGVLVEPSEAAFKKLHQLYSVESFDRYCIKLVQAAITLTDGPIDFYDSGTHLKKGDVALLSTTRPEELERWKKSGEEFTKTSVRGITFETLMKETGVTQFQFISIDCEGADWDVLTQIDLRKVGCELLCVEYNAKDAHRFIGYAAGAGMKLLHKNYENLIFSV